MGVEPEAALRLDCLACVRNKQKCSCVKVRFDMDNYFAVIGAKQLLCWEQHRFAGFLRVVRKRRLYVAIVPGVS